MTDTERPSSGCEGRCGVTLHRLGHGWWETAPGPGGGAIPGWELEFVAEHTPDRCRAIRVLREAAEDVIAAELVAVVAGSESGHDVLVVRAGTPGGPSDSRWAEVSWRVEHVVGVPRNELDRIANITAGTLNDVLDGGTPTRAHPLEGAVLTRGAAS